MLNFFHWLTNEKGIDVFFPKEDMMIKYLREYTDSLGNEVIN